MWMVGGMTVPRTHLASPERSAPVCRQFHLKSDIHIYVMDRVKRTTCYYDRHIMSIIFMYNIKLYVI